MLSIGEFARVGGVTRRALRHYGELGILLPAKVDATTGYRYYAVEQLAALRRIVVLRDLGIGLEQIRDVLGEDLSVEQLRGMLRLRRSEITTSIAEHQERLRRVEAHLDALERGAEMPPVDVVVKRTDPLRVAVMTVTAAGYGYENIDPVFEAHLANIADDLVARGLRLGPCVAYYDEVPDSDEILVHLGFEIGDQELGGSDALRVEDLPVIEVASTIHRGSMVVVTDIFEEMLRWIEASGFRFAGVGREIYWKLDWDQSLQVTELQLPIVAS